MFFLILSIPAFIVLLHTICVINAMSPKSSELIRWSNIAIGLGTGMEIIALLSVYSAPYATWEGIKIMFGGAIMMNFGYAVLYLVGCKKCDCNNGFRNTVNGDSIKEQQ